MPTFYVLSKIKKNIKIFQLKISIFIVVKIYSILHYTCFRTVSWPYVVHSSFKLFHLSHLTRKPVLWGFSTRSHTNQTVQPQNTARRLKVGFRKRRDCTNV